MPKFQPGVSGNPRGRPKNSISTALRKRVDMDEVADTIWKKARQGDKWALDTILNRLEPMQQALTLKHQAVRSERPRFDYSKLTDVELATIQGILERATARTVEGSGRDLPTLPEAVPAGGVGND